MKQPVESIIATLLSRGVHVWRRPTPISFSAGYPNAIDVPRGVKIEPHARLAVYESLYSIGSFSYCMSSLPGSVTIGRYCSIAAGVSVLGPNHPIDRISTSPFTYDQGFARLYSPLSNKSDFSIIPFARYSRPVHIGNDVWIGEGVSIAQGVVIGTGSIIAGRSHVTKDVEPYTIVGGNPAKMIRRRFNSDSLISDLLHSEWWKYNFLDFSGMPLEDPRQFLEALKQRKSDSAIATFDPPAITYKDLS